MNCQNKPTPETLMARFKTRLDGLAFEQLVAEYASPAAAVANQMLNDRALAEDAVQETFIRVINKRSHYLTSRPFSPWFYTILRHVCVDILRRRRRDRDSIRQLSEGLKRCVDSKLPTDHMFLLSALPPHERSVIELRTVHSMSFKEIAAALDISEEAAKKRAQRGLRTLRRAFRESDLAQRRAV